jgi:hypothetical protein
MPHQRVASDFPTNRAAVKSPKHISKKLHTRRAETA